MYVLPFSSQFNDLDMVTTCVENLEMSGILTAVNEMSGILVKVREMSGKSGLKPLAAYLFPFLTC